MTPSRFRRIALSLPGASEGAHMGTADFRVGNKIFATLGNPDAASGVIGLTPDQQALLIETTPNVFVRCRADGARAAGPASASPRRMPQR